MTIKQKDESMVINEAMWECIKPRVKSTKEYKQILSDVFKLYVKFDDMPDKFSDEWWDEACSRLTDYCEKWYKKDQASFAAELTMGFLDWWEKESRYDDAGRLDFLACLGKPFINELSRLRHEPHMGILTELTLRDFD